jgi:flagellar biosynthesis/type III secretory pathway M-ring protein FliF/YscJ
LNLSGNTFVAIAADGRLFGLDPQLLFDAAVTAVNVFVLFLLLTFILFNPVRNMLKKRQDKITSDRENAENDKKEAGALKAEYVDFQMNYTVDESLIGGMVIRIGDRVVDSSIKHKIDELSRSLMKVQL